MTLSGETANWITSSKMSLHGLIHFRAKVTVQIGFTTAKALLEQLTNTVLSFVVNRYALFTVRVQPNVFKYLQPQIMIYLNSIHGATYQIIGFILIFVLSIFYISVSSLQRK